VEVCPTWYVQKVETTRCKVCRPLPMVLPPWARRHESRGASTPLRLKKTILMRRVLRAIRKVSREVYDDHAYLRHTVVP
jgi:hypothetical protein